MTLYGKIHRARRCGTRYASVRGFSLVSAIFLLVVLAGLGVAMVNVSTVHQTSSALDVQGVRAYQAARAGIEWGLFRQIRQSSCPGSGAPASFQLPAGSTLSTFIVTVTCQRTAGPVVDLDRYRISSVACNEPQAAEPRCPNPYPSSVDYVQRVVQVDF